MKWNRTQHGPIEGGLLDYLEAIINEELDQGNKLKICIGTDSQKQGKNYKFASVIIIERKLPLGIEKGKMVYRGAGAMELYAITHEPFMKINERMIKEVEKTVQIGYEIYELLDLYDIDLELHADINQNAKYASNVALNSALGYMSGIPCTVRVKPDAYAASTGADKLC